jgi:CheY-like chemotaxis protein
MENRDILLVDGHEDSARAVTHLLESRGYAVNVITDGDAVLEKARQFPDLILLERTLPDRDGLELCRLIREDKRLHYIPVVILAAGI